MERFCLGKRALSANKSSLVPVADFPFVNDLLHAILTSTEKKPMEDTCSLASDSQAIYLEVKSIMTRDASYFPPYLVPYDRDAYVCCTDRILEHLVTVFFSKE